MPERLLAETFRIDIRGIEEVNAAINRSLDQPIGFALTDCADHFEETVASFVKIFSGMSRLKLAGAIFLNNAFKTLLAILLGTLLGIIPGIFLFANGLALGVAWSLSSSSRGPWLSLLSILPHGMIELPAVFLGTSIGLMIGFQAFQRLFGRSEAKIGGEVVQGLRYFCTVIMPLLLAAAFVEAFVTASLIAPR